MQFQLRDYQIKPGQMNEWITEWSRHVRPLREAAGFGLVGAWVARGENRFIWILGREDFEAADRRYYLSDQRRSIDPDPARHLAHSAHIFVDPVR
jgi:hypothetical protein